MQRICLVLVWKVPSPPKGLLGWLLTLPRYLFRAHLGFLMGHRFLVLVSQGRKSGLRRETPLEVVRYDKAKREAIVAAGWGRKTQWLHNVEAGLAREIWIGRERYVPSYRILDVTPTELGELKERNRLLLEYRATRDMELEETKKKLKEAEEEIEKLKKPLFKRIVEQVIKK